MKLNILHLLLSVRLVLLPAHYQHYPIAGKAWRFFCKIESSHKVDFSKLEYISSAGLGILIGTQKRLNDSGHELVLTKMTPHIRDVLRYAGFDMVFKIK